MVYDIALQKLMRLYLSLGIGALVMMLMLLTYLDIWRPRRQTSPSRGGIAGVLRWWFGAIPWVATLTILGLSLFALAFSIYKMLSPPNW